MDYKLKWKVQLKNFIKKEDGIEMIQRINLNKLNRIYKIEKLILQKKRNF